MPPSPARADRDPRREALPASRVLSHCAHPGDRLAARKPQLGCIANLDTVEILPGKPLTCLMEWMKREKARILHVGPTAIAANGSLAALSLGKGIPPDLKLLHASVRPMACLYVRE